MSKPTTKHTQHLPMPALPTSPEDAGQQLEMPTTTNPYPANDEAIRVAREMNMGISSPGGVTNLPVESAMQIPAPLPGVQTSAVKGGVTKSIKGANVGPSTNAPTDPNLTKKSWTGAKTKKGR